MLTRREIHIVIVFAITIVLIFASGVDQQTMNDYELAWLLLYVLPIGTYIVTDPERRKRAGQK